MADTVKTIEHLKDSVAKREAELSELYSELNEESKAKDNLEVALEEVKEKLETCKSANSTLMAEKESEVPCIPYR